MNNELDIILPTTFDSCSPNSSSLSCKGVFSSLLSAILSRILPVNVRKVHICFNVFKFNKDATEQKAASLHKPKDYGN